MKVYSRFITEIKSHSHVLNESAFSFLMSEETLTRVSDIREDRFKVEVIMTDEIKETCNDYFGYGFAVSSRFLMALNISALGHFTWAKGNNVFWHFEHMGPSGIADQIVMKSKDMPLPTEMRILTNAEVSNAVIICGSLLREVEQNFRLEYLKGITHLDIGFGDLNFNREAFANFYRSFEYFITNKVFKKKKLKKELKTFQEGIRQLGLGEEFCDEFKALYKIRSEQIMHAQRLPIEISGEDILKIKAFTDYALHKYYRSIAEEWLAQKKSTIKQIG